MISVKLFPTLAARSKSKQRELALPFSQGITPLDILESEGFQEDYIKYVAVMVNGRQAEIKTPLGDGDVVDLMVPIAGGVS